MLTPYVLGSEACESHAADDDDDGGDGLSEIYCHCVLYIHCADVLVNAELFSTDCWP